MAIKKIILALMIFSIAIITGCTGGSNSQVTISDPYMGGSQGLLASFESLGVSSDGTTQSIFDDESFSLVINLKNKGEYEIPANTMKTVIKGISPSDYTGITFQKSNSESVEKISQANPKGGEIIITHGTGKLVANRIKDRNALTASIYADIIYPYQTFIAVPKVCMKDTSSKVRDNICEVENVNLQVFSSGAPVRAVSAKEMRSGKGLVSVEFTIENVGGGESKDPAKTDFDYRYNEISFKVKESSSNPNDWDCKSSGREGVGRFGEDNKLTILCKLTKEIPANQVYQEQLDLTLKYDYKSIINSDLVIKNKDV